MSAARPITPALAKAFRALRVKRGMTQEDFVPTSGRTYISELERGAKRPTLSKLDELAERLSVHPLVLITLAYSEVGADQAVDDLLELVKEQVEDLTTVS